MKINLECHTSSLMTTITTIIVVWLITMCWTFSYAENIMEDCLKITNTQEEYVKCVGFVDYEKIATKK